MKEKPAADLRQRFKQENQLNVSLPFKDKVYAMARESVTNQELKRMHDLIPT